MWHPTMGFLHASLSACTCHEEVTPCRPVHAQALTVLTMVTAAKLHAHPLERVFLLLPFFLGSAEIASGVLGL